MIPETVWLMIPVRPGLSSFISWETPQLCENQDVRSSSPFISVSFASSPVRFLPIEHLRLSKTSQVCLHQRGDTYYHWYDFSGGVYRWKERYFCTVKQNCFMGTQRRRETMQVWSKLLLRQEKWWMFSRQLVQNCSARFLLVRGWLKPSDLRLTLCCAGSQPCGTLQEAKTLKSFWSGFGSGPAT